MSTQKRGVILDISQIYNEHKNSVYRLALTYMHSAGEAEDICHDVFMRLIQNRDAVYEGRERAWLMSVTANLCKDRLRFYKRHSEESLPEDMPYDSGSFLEITDAVMSLSVKERTVIYLYYYEGYSTAEIGKMQRISRSAVTSRLERARKHLKNRLEEE